MVKGDTTALPPRGGGRFSSLLFGALLSLAPLASHPGDVGLAAVRLDAPGVIRSGQSLTVTWDPLPHDTEEFELLLRCESPVPITLRLTESHDPDLARLTWRVPRISTDRARILVRRGRRGDESLWARSAPFQIAPCEEGSSSRIALRRGEFWLTEEPSGRLSPRHPGYFGGGRDNREDPVEGSDPSPDAFLGSPATGPGSPPPSPDAVFRRAWVAPNGETRPLPLRI